MKTGSQDTFVIPWSQTETDGVRGAPRLMLSVGVTWRWSRAPVRVDGPQDLLVLAEEEGIGELHRRAARMVQRLTGIKASKLAEKAGPDLPQQSYAVTDGHHFHVITVVAAPGTGALLLTVTGLPPPDCDLWVVRLGLDRATTAPAKTGAVICFTPGAFLDTPTGPRAIQDLRQGHRVLTRDNGAQMVLWRGERRDHRRKIPRNAASAPDPLSPEHHGA